MAQTPWRMAQSGLAGAVVLGAPDSSPAPLPLPGSSLELGEGSVAEGSVTAATVGEASVGLDRVGAAGPGPVDGVEGVEPVDSVVNDPVVEGEPAVMLPAVAPPVGGTVTVVPATAGTAADVVVPGEASPGEVAPGAEVEPVLVPLNGDSAEDAAAGALGGVTEPARMPPRRSASRVPSAWPGLAAISAATASCRPSVLVLRARTGPTAMAARAKVTSVRRRSRLGPLGVAEQAWTPCRRCFFGLPAPEFFGKACRRRGRSTGASGSWVRCREIGAEGGDETACGWRWRPVVSGPCPASCTDVPLGAPDGPGSHQGNSY